MNMTPSDATSLNLLGLCFILTVGLLVLTLPRRFAFIPIIITTCYITYGQQLNILGFNFTALRLVILVAWIRLLARGEIRAIQLNSIDKVFIWWLVISLIANMLLWQSSEALVNNFGRIYNAVGLYFLFRVLIRDISEIENLIKISAIIILPLSLIMIFEKFSGTNIFSLFGGVDEISWVRSGSVRAQGPFRFAGLAGTVGAVLMPLYVALWFSERAKFYAFIGVAAATIITIASHSSGPLIAYCVGIVALIMWPFHDYMRMIRYSILFTLLSLHMIMKAPVWALIARLGGVTGGTAYHRAAIIDAAINHFNEWWLIGTRDTGHWLALSAQNFKFGHDSADITNNYVSEGINGGLVSMFLFIIIIILCFREIGISLRVNKDQPFSIRIIIWSLGVSLLVHVCSFMSVIYFDQTIGFWYLSLAMISALSISEQPLQHSE